MSDDVLVSVHFITYNHEAYIAQAIESVLAQKTNFKFELIIGEDLSPDNTRQICLDYADKYPDIIKVLTSEKNLGCQGNAERVRKACRGKYLAYLEGDDYWQRTDKLQMQVDFLENNPEYGLVCSYYDEFIQGQSTTVPAIEISKGKNYVKEPDVYDILRGDGDVLTCTVMVKRDLIMNAVDADPFLHGTHFKMGDTQLWSEVALASKIYRMDDSLGTRRVIPESITRSGKREKVLRFWQSNSEMCAYLCKKHNLGENITKEFQRLWTKQSLKIAFLSKDAALAKEAKEKYPEFMNFNNRMLSLGATNGVAHAFLEMFNKVTGRKL